MQTQPISLARLERHTQNARDHSAYRKADLADLVASIREHGLLQPLVVTRKGDGYMILAGHRRHAALELLRVDEVPCLVLDDADDDAALRLVDTQAAVDRLPVPRLDLGRAPEEGPEGEETGDAD